MKLALASFAATSSLAVCSLLPLECYANAPQTSGAKSAFPAAQTKPVDFTNVQVKDADSFGIRWRFIPDSPISSGAFTIVVPPTKLPEESEEYLSKTPRSFVSARSFSWMPF